MSAAGCPTELGSRASAPDITWYARAASRAQLASGPRYATDQHNGAAPCSLMRPYVGLSPTTPQNDAGRRIEPPPSAPMAIGTSPAPTTQPGPAELPPV